MRVKNLQKDCFYFFFFPYLSVISKQIYGTVFVIDIRENILRSLMSDVHTIELSWRRSIFASHIIFSFKVYPWKPDNCLDFLVLMLERSNHIIHRWYGCGKTENEMTELCLCSELFFLCAYEKTSPWTTIVT